MSRKELGHGPSMVNIRLRADPGTRVTKRALADVLDSIRSEGVVPVGWSFASIEWTNPKRADMGWRRGSADDLEKFRPILKAMSKSELLESFRAAEVQGREPMGARERRRVVELRGRADKWHRARSKEIKARDRLKGRAARVKREKRAEIFRSRYQRAIDALEAIEYPEGKEYELAADYKGRKGRK